MKIEISYFRVSKTTITIAITTKNMLEDEFFIRFFALSNHRMKYIIGLGLICLCKL